MFVGLLFLTAFSYLIELHVWSARNHFFFPTMPQQHTIEFHHRYILRRTHKSYSSLSWKGHHSSQIKGLIRILYVYLCSISSRIELIECILQLLYLQFWFIFSFILIISDKLEQRDKKVISTQSIGLNFIII